MATFYFTYRKVDVRIVDALVPRLQKKGHIVNYDKKLYIGAAWRQQLMDALLEADAVVLIWTEETHESNYVPAEAGVVRATPRIALMPVIVGPSETPIPGFVQDLNAEWLTEETDEHFDRLAEKLHESVAKHLKHLDRRSKGWPNLFISHRHKDEPIAKALVHCLEEYFHIEVPDIRCSSVQPYRLPVGTDTADRLRDEISKAEIVLGILTPDTQDSSYVLFELGSAWGQQVWTCPLLARGADYASIPDPIQGRSSLSLEKTVECHQLLGDLSLHTSLKRKEGPDLAAVADRVQDLVRAASVEM